MVIFVHELGHFLVAKWNGVKVEKFSIGFGTPLIAWRKGVGVRFLSSVPIPDLPTLAPAEGTPSSTRPGPGETEYALAMIPLGGFVKMLGESLEEEGARTTDPRAYPNKSVWARMAIISAGVIMNVIFGLICFAFVYRNGVKEIEPVIGAVQPGSPAYIAGLRPGDAILAIGTKPTESFADLRARSALSGQGESLRLEIRRPGVESPLVFQVEPRIDPGRIIPTVGLASTLRNELDAKRPLIAMPGRGDDPAWATVDLQPGDSVVGIGPEGGPIEPVTSIQDVNRLLTKHRAGPIAMMVHRKTVGPEARDSRPHQVVVPPLRMLDYGIRFEIGPIDSIRKDSPADSAGFRPGDRIVQVNGQDDFDPMRLPYSLFDRAGQETEIVVSRSLPGSAKGQLLTLKVTPEPNPTGIDLAVSRTSPLDVPAIGLCYRIEPRVAAVRPGSPADKAGIQAGATIHWKYAKLTGPKGNEIKQDTPTEGEEAYAWPNLFQESTQFVPGFRLGVVVDNAAKPIELVPEPVDDWFSTDRGLRFTPLVRELPPQGLVSAMKRGIDDVYENGIQVFLMIRGLIQGRVSLKGVSGPIGLVYYGGEIAKRDWTDFARFLGQISISLAVFNFLPIPPLDGGQMVFLAAEKVRGRPLPESALAPVTWIGLLLLLSLMALVLFQDIWGIVQDLLRSQ